MKFKFVLGYLLSIVLVNFAFSYLPLVDLPLDQKIPVGTLLVGFIFVIRDYAQKEVGNWVYLAMFVGVILSYVMADPFVAIASAVAFAISEIVDALVFTYTDKSMKDRILISSAASTPVDSAVFLLMLGFFNWFGFVVMIVVKMIGAVVVWKMLDRQ